MKFILLLLSIVINAFQFSLLFCLLLLTITGPTTQGSGNVPNFIYINFQKREYKREDKSLTVLVVQLSVFFATRNSLMILVHINQI